MGLIPAETLEDIRAKTDIVELVGEYVPQMQRAGRHVKARCPFHQERTPSFIVSPERQTYHCFGCGEGGDAFSFLMKMENLSFSEAAEKLAQRAGVRITLAPESMGPEARERLKIKELLGFAADFYHSLLLKSPEAAAARRYLSGRSVSEEMLEAFRVGYAPSGGGLGEAALKKGYARELLLKAGLAAVRGGRLRDYFFGRVLFPIQDAKGAVVGFGGRTLGQAEPKYLNSPDSPLFSKGRLLYGLFQGLSMVRRERRALLMEGYLDVIAAHQHGLSTACAPLGTALTAEHAALLKRYATQIVIVFDSDRAGLAAAVRGGDILLAAGFGVRVVTLPGGKDPDEHLHEFGVQSFQERLAQAADLVDFKTGWLLGQREGLTPESKSAVAREVLGTILRCQDEILKGEWIRRLAQRLGVSEEALRRGMGKLGELEKGGRSPRAVGPQGASGGEEISGADRDILALLFKEPSLAARVREEDLGSQARGIWRALRVLEPFAEGWPARLLSALGPSERPVASRLLLLVEELESAEPEKVLEDILSHRRGLARLREIEPQVLAGTDPALKDEYRSLVVKLKGTKR